MEKLKLKESIYILKDSEDIYSTIFTSTRKVKKFRVDDLTKEIIENLKTPKSESELINLIKKDYSTENIYSCINSLEKFGLVRKYDFSKMDERNYRQLQFIDELTESWEETLNLQKKIEDSKVAVLGVGGIGTWIVNGLYQIGVGEIRINDPDKISKSNLNRQLFFFEEDVGKYKVDVIKLRIKDAKIMPYKKFVSKEANLGDILEGTDMIVNCADFPSVEETSKVVDKYASKHRISYCISGGYNMHLGMIGPIIVPGKTKSFNEFLEYQKRHDPLTKLNKIKDIEQTGNLGPIAGTIANFQVMEIFKHLIDKGSRNYNKFAEIDFMNLNIKWINF